MQLLKVCKIYANFRRRDFIDSISSAPKDIRQLNRGLSIISDVLQRLQDVSYELQDDQLMRSALQSCKDSVDDIHSSLDDFCEPIASSDRGRRLRASVRMVNKGNFIAKLQRQLESAKTTLILAEQSASR